MRREIEDLKERLSMGQEEFKEKYVECLNLQQQVKKLQRVAGTLSSCVSPLPTVLIDTFFIHLYTLYIAKKHVIKSYMFIHRL